MKTTTTETRIVAKLAASKRPLLYVDLASCASDFGDLAVILGALIDSGRVRSVGNGYALAA